MVVSSGSKWPKCTQKKIADMNLDNQFDESYVDQYPWVSTVVVLVLYHRNELRQTKM